MSRKILIVDDNDINRQYLRSILSNEDTQLLSASSGIIALKMLEQHIPDIILMDIQMPEMDGFECVRIIKRDFQNYPSLIFAVTGYSDDFGNATFKQTGFDDLFLKPIKAEVFKRQLEESLNKRKEEDAKHSENKQISDAQTIDVKTVNELRKYAQGDELLEIYKEFEVDTSNALSKLESLIRGRNSDEILIILHTVKGNAASLGLTSVASLCEHMEHKLRGSSTSNLAQDFSQLTSLFHNFVSNYVRILNQE